MGLILFACDSNIGMLMEMAGWGSQKSDGAKFSPLHLDSETPENLWVGGKHDGGNPNQGFSTETKMSILGSRNKGEEA